MPAEPAQKLRITLVIVLAGMFAAAGASKIIGLSDDRGGAGATMIGRYLTTQQAVRAVGCAEIGLALWLVSGRSQRTAGALFALILVIFGLLIGTELSRDRPLPCGCLELRPGNDDPHAVRVGLWIALVRNILLIVMAGLLITLVPPPPVDPTAASYTRHFPPRAPPC